MIGNVWEWTDSLYKPYPGGQTVRRAAGDEHVIRGGGWMWPRGGMPARCTSRGFHDSKDFSIDLGFRCVMSAGRKGATE